MSHPARYVRSAAALLVALSLVASPAAAKKKIKDKPKKDSRPAVTMMRFKLADHDVESGATVDGTVLLMAKGRHHGRSPIEGAALTVKVDGEDVGTVVTDAEGRAVVSHAAADGDHVMKVFYAGDADHKRSHRAQGFEVGAMEDGTETPDDGESETPDEGEGDMPDEDADGTEEEIVSEV